MVMEMRGVVVFRLLGKFYFERSSLFEASVLACGLFGRDNNGECRGDPCPVNAFWSRPSSLPALPLEKKR